MKRSIPICNIIFFRGKIAYFAMGNLDLVVDTGLPDGNNFDNTCKFSKTPSLPNIQHQIAERQIPL